MCIAIHKPKNVLLSDEHMEESFVSNPDGAGFAVACNGRIILRKGYFTYKAFSEAFEPFRDDAALVHFRIATSGGINADMCHPFLLAGGKYALIHNGILSIRHDKEVESDTSAFCRLVLTPLLDAGVSLHSTALKYLVEEAIGRYNKMVIMDEYGKSVIFNEDEGHERGGIWYSNRSYLPYAKVTCSWEAGKSTWKQTPKLLGTPGTEYCWYCGTPFTPEGIEDVLCSTCDKEEEAQYLTTGYKRQK